MHIGVVFPQTEIGRDRGAVRAFASAASELGYQHLIAYDHVVGSARSSESDAGGVYDIDSMFHEPFVLFGYLAALTELELVTGVLVLPQRQTVLVAKQAAEVDLLTGGKLRLGVGVGWNASEYAALGQDFTRRGARLDEQIELMRRLWAGGAVRHSGSFDSLSDVGLNPLPVQQPIPVWIGGMSDAALRRAGRIGDGWFPLVQPGPKLSAAQSVVRHSAEALGRDLGTIGMQGYVNCALMKGERLLDRLARWEECGATHVALSTMNAQLPHADAHLSAIAEASSTIADLLRGYG